ncbi:hypothetical protein ACF0H5_004630 [Mactra antiquata]
MVISKIFDHENTTTQKRKQNKSKEPSAGPSKLQTLNPSVVISDSESDKEADEVPCCVCTNIVPQDFEHESSFAYIKWVKCDNCSHWTHIGFCTEARVFRRGAVYVCPHCNEE